MKKNKINLFLNIKDWNKPKIEITKNKGTKIVKSIDKITNNLEKLKKQI